MAQFEWCARTYPPIPRLNIENSQSLREQTNVPVSFCKGPDYKNQKDDTTGQIKNEIYAVKKMNASYISDSFKTELSIKFNQISNLINQLLK